MKKFVFVFLLAGMCLPGLWAQDIIMLHDSTEIVARVLQVSPEEIKYRRADNPEGPVFILPTGDVLIVHYANGTSQTFNPSPPPMLGGADIRPDMRYRDYKKRYRPLVYPSYPHSPALSGICSWWIPGLGQMICGEVGRGFAFFGGFATCIGVMALGFSSNTTQGTAVATLAAIGYLTIDICAVVDAVRVAKVKNLYEQDLHRLASTVGVTMQPYVSSLSTATVRTPVAGVSLAVSF